MTEQDIQSRIRVALSEHGLVFRTNAGEFWQGKRVFSREYQQFVLINLQRIQGLPRGFSDLLFVSHGKTAFIECKTGHRKPSPEQEMFLAKMREFGHLAGVARCEEDAIKIILEEKS